MTKPNIIIFGSGGEAKVVASTIRALGIYNLTGFAREKDEAAALKNCKCGVIAIGNSATREKIAARILEQCPGFEFPALIHPSAVVEPTATIGAGSIIHALAYVGVDTKLGRHVVVNTGARIDHDNMIDDFASLAPGVITGGTVRIGRGSFVGLGSSIIQDIVIGHNVVIGAGTVIVRDVQNDTKLFRKSPIVSEAI